MKKGKRILALAGAVLLFGMYAVTLIFALTDHSETLGLLKASVAVQSSFRFCYTPIPWSINEPVMIRMMREPDNIPGEPDL